jgi:hypothetical protein
MGLFRFLVGTDKQSVFLAMGQMVLSTQISIDTSLIIFAVTA